MVQKYVDTTLLTGLNDGSSIANAWQDLRAVMENTQAAGTYTAGDTINIRSHDGTSNITADLGITALAQAAIGTEHLPVTWLVDDGTIWPTAGIFRMQHGGDTIKVSFSSHNVWKAKTKYKFSIYSSGTSHVRNWGISGNNKFVNVEFDRATPGYNAAQMILLSNPGLTHTTDISSNHIFIGCRFVSKMSRLTDGGTYPYIGIFGLAMNIEMIDCDFDLTNHTPTEAYIQGVSGQNGGSAAITGSTTLRIRGGKITSPNPAISFIRYYSSAYPQTSRDGMLTSIIGLDAGTQPITYEHLGAAATVLRSSNGHFITEGINGIQQSKVEKLTGVVEWAPANNFPQLTSMLPDSLSTTWSLRVYGDKCSKTRPLGLTTISKFFNEQVPNTKVASLELLIKDTSIAGATGAFNNPQKDQWWMEITYVDNASGKYVVESTESAGALLASSAPWTPLAPSGKVTYGGADYIRYKLELTTSNAIKPDTMIYIEVWSTKPSLAPTDYYFVNPDLSLV